MVTILLGLRIVLSFESFDNDAASLKMTIQIALLRAVNVGGIKVSMADLRVLLSDLAFQDTHTLLNSGNAVFRSQNQTGSTLEKSIETEFTKRTGSHTDFFVRTADEWKEIIARNPLTEEAKRDPGHLLLLLLKRAPTKQELEALRAAIVGPETIEVDGRQAYAFYRAGIGESKLTLKLIEKKLGTAATGRNWNTVLKLAALAESL
jgi:uncharacterized protein (DUF1697 family)